jgi:hypothetical protein
MRYGAAPIGVDGKSAEVGPGAGLKARLLQEFPPCRLARVFAVLEMTAGENEADPARPVPVLSINVLRPSIVWMACGANGRNGFVLQN